MRDLSQHDSGKGWLAPARQEPGRWAGRSSARASGGRRDTDMPALGPGSSRSPWLGAGRGWPRDSAAAGSANKQQPKLLEREGDATTRRHDGWQTGHQNLGKGKARKTRERLFKPRGKDRGDIATARLRHILNLWRGRERTRVEQVSNYQLREKDSRTRGASAGS